MAVFGSNRKALQNFSDLVKPGGMLIFSENLLQGDEVRLEHQVSRKECDVFLMLTEHGFKLRRRIPMFIFMNDSVRTKNRLMKKLFSFTYLVASKSEIYGKIVGMILYPIDFFLIKVLNVGLSTEIFVWEKRSKHTDGDANKWKETNITNNVSIGTNASILPVVICSNVVIDAGSVVSENIFEASVHAGNPAVKIRGLIK